MGVDEATLRLAARQQQATPWLRFYQWEVPTLSLGYFQPLAERDQHQPSRQCKLVRRSTGGGAILHHLEWTYSLVVRSDARFHSQSLYDDAHQALIGVLGDLGIDARLVSEDGQRNHQTNPAFLCFQRRSTGDVVVGDHKVLGSAQRRIGQTILQHGSLILERSPNAPEIAGLYDLATLDVSPVQLRDLWIERLAEIWDWQLEKSDWNPEEKRGAAEWQTCRFAEDGWTQRR